ncbi:hypothetical protein Poli38472_012530 [Pythium oligandrum]|uniref:Uncharacterized protein n=1 Tax=Pythium oligandrum TaxID=41045 RepID=A0A8K1CE20_PYTOL|nr:hypothetical protein Poli38472_012530 [Pythium oligandrum]|eukprot:TMW61339.1 hypothetical protein Poli38472_012530 [Pythium oligandrum]
MSSDEGVQITPLRAADGRGWILEGKTRQADDLKKEYHREAMAAFRLRKKASVEDMQAMRAYLERQLQQRLELRRAILLSGFAEEYGDDVDERFLRFQDAFCALVDEAELYRADNVKLQEQIESHTRLRLLLHFELGLVRLPEEDSSPSSDGGSSPSPELRGFFTYFMEHEPPFYYEPFTQQECDAIVDTGLQVALDLLSAFDNKEHGMQEAHCLGWRAQRSLQRIDIGMGTEGDGPAVSRVRFTKSIQCRKENTESTMESLVNFAWEVTTTPKLYARIHRTLLISHPLQSMGDDREILMRNTPDPTGAVNIRYFNLIERVKDTTTEGHPRTTIHMLIADSPRHQQLRELDQREDVLWMTEGSGFISFTQTSDESIEIDFSHVAVCMNEMQAQYFLVELGAMLIRWENLVMPPRLLRFD